MTCHAAITALQIGLLLLLLPLLLLLTGCT